jgi:arylsulfatase A-like enzyme
MAISHTSAYGYDRNTTPNIDRLAEDSFVFTRAFSQSSHTTPSLYSTFSSTYPSDHSVREGSEASGNMTLLAEFLKEQGYYTFSSNTGTAAKGSLGFEQGFDRYSQHFINESHHERYHRENGTQIEFMRRQLEKSPEKFFLFYQSMGTHDPYIVEKKYTQMYGPELPSFRNESRQLWDRLKENYPDSEAYPRFREYYFGKASENETIRRVVVSRYDASLRRTDSYVGDIISLLKSEGEYEDSIIIVNSQHGEQFGEHGKWRHDTSLYNEVIQVPLIIHFPGQKERKEIDSYVGNFDIFPTVADLVSDRIPESLRSQWRGKSLLTVISGDSGARTIFAERLDRTALMDGTAHIKRYENSSGVFYFNLSSDFEERNPLKRKIGKVEGRYRSFIERFN